MTWGAIGASVAGAGASYLLNRGSGSSSPTSTVSQNQSNSNTWAPNPAVSSIYDWLAQQAKSLGGASQPYYPGQTYVSPSGLTQQGVSRMRQAAGYAPGIASMYQRAAGYAPAAARTQQQGLDVANQNYKFLSNAADVANNPYVQGMLGVNQQQVNQNLQRNLLPAIQSGAQQVGAMGSSRMGLAQGQAIGDTSTALANANAGLLNSAYGQGLSAQQSALGQTGEMLQNQLAPGKTLAWGAGLLGDAGRAQEWGAGLLGQAGQVVEGYQQKALQDQMARYNYQYQQPWANIGNVGGILNMLQGTGVSSGTGGGSTTSPNQNYQNPWQQALGGAMAGYGLYNQYQRSY